MHKAQKVQERDATEVHSSNAVGFIIGIQFRVYV